MQFAIVAAVLLLLVFAWNFTPLQRWADPDTLAAALIEVRDEWWIYPAMVAAYLVFGLLLFPLMALVAVTGLVLGPWKGFLVAMTGSLDYAQVFSQAPRLEGETLQVLEGTPWSAITSTFVSNPELMIASCPSDWSQYAWPDPV